MKVIFLFLKNCLASFAGTSSILAGAVIAALYRVSGHSTSVESLIHAVLHLEQVLTTGKSGLPWMVSPPTSLLKVLDREGKAKKGVHVG